MILDDLLSFAAPQIGAQVVTDVRIGLGYTCVELSGGGCGLAYTFRHASGYGCSVAEAAGTLLGKSVAEMLSWSQSDDRIKAALGVATLNALINHAGPETIRANLTEVLELRAQDTFGMVGAFRPILQRVRSLADKIYVFEEAPTADSNFYLSSDIPRYLPSCDVVVLTATSLINQTLDEVLSYCQGAREVCLVGPSTPLCPAVFGRYGVSLLAGSLVIEPGLALNIVSQGGGTRQLRPAIAHVLERTL